MKKTKGFDVKLLLLNHGEKMVAGLIGLLALMGLASASWSGETRTPEEMKAIAAKTQSKMESSVWPETDQVDFGKTPDVTALTQRMAEPSLDADKFAPSIAFNEPLNRRREKRGAVSVLAVVDPEQTSVTVPIALIPLETEEKEPEVKGKTKGKTGKDKQKEETKEEKERRERLGPAGGGLAGGLPPGAAGLGGLGAAGLGGLGAAGLGGQSYTGDPAASGLGLGMGLGGGSDAGGAGMGMGRGMMMGMGSMGMGMGGEGDMYGEGYGDAGMYGGYLGAGIAEKRIQYSAAISVRYVFELREQRKKIAAALHLPEADPRVAAYAEDFVDLHVERKQAIPATDPWSGAWEPVPTEDLADILDESLAFDMEIVNPLVTRPVITMPLPRRAAGVWVKDVASHKRISEFVLSDEEKELIKKRNEKLAEEAEKLKEQLPPTRAEKKGFTGYVANANDLMGSMYGNTGVNDFNNSFMSEYANGMGETPDAVGAAGSPQGRTSRGKSTEEQKKKAEELRKKLFDPDATNRLLLVRFFDFTAERGQQYIYRVRLELNNPNFNVPVDDLVQPELATQKTIMSDWSEPTQPVLLPLEYRYYVNKVSTSGSEERAELSMYYEVSDKGTSVMADLQVPTGIRIGGEKEVDVVDFSKSVLDKYKIDFRSRDLLCAVNESPRLSGSDHPDLQAFLQQHRGQKPIPDQILVLNPSGALVVRTAGDLAADERRDKGDVEYLIKEYEKLGWRKPDPADVGAGDPFGAFGDADMSDGGMGMGSMGMGGMGMGYGDPLSGGSGREGRGGRGGSRGGSSRGGSSRGGGYSGRGE